jgi:hypothetical protein
LFVLLHMRSLTGLSFMPRYHGIFYHVLYNMLDSIYFGSLLL